MHNLIEGDPVICNHILWGTTSFISYGCMNSNYCSRVNCDSKQKLKLACGSFSEQFSPFNLQTPLKLNTSKLTQSPVNFALVKYVSRAVYF